MLQLDSDWLQQNLLLSLLINRTVLTEYKKTMGVH